MRFRVWGSVRSGPHFIHSFNICAYQSIDRRIVSDLNGIGQKGWPFGCPQQQRWLIQWMVRFGFSILIICLRNHLLQSKVVKIQWPMNEKDSGIYKWDGCACEWKGINHFMFVLINRTTLNDEVSEKKWRKPGREPFILHTFHVTLSSFQLGSTSSSFALLMPSHVRSKPFRFRMNVMRPSPTQNKPTRPACDVSWF